MFKSPDDTEGEGDIDVADGTKNKMFKSPDDTEGEGEIDVADGTRLTDTTFRGATKLTCA